MKLSTTLRRLSRATAVAITPFLPLFSAQAVTIVNWDGGIGGQDYLSGTAPNSSQFNGATSATDVSYAGGAATDRQQIRPFSTSTVLSPSAAAYPNTVNSSLYSTTFYGAYESLVLDSASGTAFNNPPSVRDGTAGSGPQGSVLTATGRRPSGSSYIQTYALGFQKSNFLNGGNTGALTLSEMHLTFVNPSVTSGTASNMRGRWLIQNGSTFYISQTTFSLDAGTSSISDFTGSLWSAYTPSTSSGTVLNFQPSSFSTVNFNDVQMVGLYAETWNGLSTTIAGSGTGVGNAQASFNLSDFSVTAIPEPSGWTYLVLSAGLWTLRRRRKLGTVRDGN